MEKKTQRAMWRVEGKLRENFFLPPYKKGASCGATVGRRIDRGEEREILGGGDARRDGRGRTRARELFRDFDIVRKSLPVVNLSEGKGAMREDETAAAAAMRACSRPLPLPVVRSWSVGFSRENIRRESEKGAHVRPAQKGTSVVGDECRKQPMRGNATSLTATASVSNERTVD